METRKVYIYALMDPITYKIRYVGKSMNPHGRLKGHIDKSIRHGMYHVNKWIRLIMRMYGITPHLYVIEECHESVWILREQYWIKYYRDLGCKLTNMTDGGECVIDSSGIIAKKISESRKEYYKNNPNIISGENNHFYGRKHSIETIEKIKLKLRGRRHSKETKKKMSEKVKKWYANNPGARSGINSPNYGRVFPKEFGENISRRARIRNESPEYKIKLSNAQKKRFSDPKNREYLHLMCGEKAAFYGRKHTDETKHKMSESAKKWRRERRERKHLEDNK